MAWPEAKPTSCVHAATMTGAQDCKTCIIIIAIGGEDGTAVILAVIIIVVLILFDNFRALGGARSLWSTVARKIYASSWPNLHEMISPGSVVVLIDAVSLSRCCRTLIRRYHQAAVRWTTRHRPLNITLSVDGKREGSNRSGEFVITAALRSWRSWRWRGTVTI